MTLSPTRRREAYLIMGIAALYLLLWLMLPKPAFWGLDNGIKYQGMRSFSETGKIVLPNPAVGLGIDSQYRAIPPPFGIISANGQIPVFSPLFQILGGIFLRLFGRSGPFLLPLIGGWGVLLASWSLWVRQRERHDGTIFLLLVGLGSPLMFYSLALWEHTLAAAAITYAIALLCSDRGGVFRAESYSGSFEAGLLVGAACGLRSESVVWALIIIVFWKGTGRSISARMRFIFGVVASAIAIALINYWQTSVPYPLHILANFLARSPDSMIDLAISRAQNIYLMLFQGFPSNALSIAGLIPLGIVALWPGWRDETGWWPYIAGGLILASAFYIYSIIAAPNQIAYTSESGGLFWVTPVAALAFFPLRSERRRFWNFMWSSVLWTILLLAAFSPTLKGIHWGPRFLIVVTPIILIAATVRIQRWWSRHAQTRIIIAVLVATCLVNQIISFGLEFKATAYNRDLNHWAQMAGDDVVLTKNWWIPGDCSLVSYKQPWFVVRNGESFAKVVKVLKEKGLRRFHYIETAPYTSEDFFTQQGLKEAGVDYFRNRGGDLRRAVLEFIAGGGVPSTAPAPVESRVSG